MPYNGAGSYAPPAADFPAVSLTLIQASKFNNIINDIATALSDAITKDGQTIVTANIPFAGFALDNARLWAVDGAVGTPAITFKNDTDSGLYRIGANNMGLALNGAKMVDYSTSGTVFSVGAGVGAVNSGAAMNVGGAGVATGTGTRAYRAGMTHPNTATATAYGFLTSETLAAGAGTYALYASYRASNVNKDVGDAVTEQMGFDCEALTTAVSNYAFRGRSTSAAGRFNLYMSGTADNALAGNLRVGSTVAPTVALDVTGQMQVSGLSAIGTTVGTANLLNMGGASLTSGTTQRGISLDPTYSTAATTAVVGVLVAGALADTGGAGTYTLSQAFRVNNVTKNGGADTLTTQIGYDTVDLTVGGTLIAGFRGQTTSGAGKWNFYASGNANNAFSGNVRIGSTVAPTVALDVTGEILASQAIRSAGATQGIGYATGAGGTVTQLTSKATGVTLNKVTGQITMNNAALAAGTRVGFTLTNSAVAATDSVLAWHVSGGTLGVYEVFTCSVGAGAVAIEVKNDSGGSLSEAIVIGFAVIKGVTS
jgi:hypothetical protein